MDVMGHSWEMKKKGQGRGIYGRARLRVQEAQNERGRSICIKENCMGSSTGAVMKETRNDSRARGS